MNLQTALARVRERGFLNEFSSMSDTWFVAHRVAGGDSGDAAMIPRNLAFRLIDEDLVERLGASDQLVGSEGTRVVWYRAKPAEPRQAAD